MVDRFQILSLDGGGYKGMFSAAVLAQLQADHGINVADHFDLVAGTSTGGIIALGLGAGLTPAELVEFYGTYGPRIFGHHGPRRPLQLVRSKYSSRPLRRALETVLGSTTLGESRLRLVVPTYDLRADKTYLFRTDHAEHLYRDWRVPMVDVALATSAAPTYLRAHHVHDLRLVDGGVWCNNPVAVALTEAVCFLGADLPNIRVLSLGTTWDVKQRPSRLDKGGIAQWAPHGTGVFLRGQAIGASNLVKNMVGKDNFLRLDPAVPDKLLRLDGLSTAELMGRAYTESREISGQFARLFTDHQATPHTSFNLTRRGT